MHLSFFGYANHVLFFFLRLKDPRSIIGWSTKVSHRLTPIESNGFLRGVLAEKIIVGDKAFRELTMISARLVKVFFLFMIPGIIILRILDLKVVKPTQFCVNISFLKRLCILRHPRPFYFIQLKRIRSLFLRKLLNSLSIILFETFPHTGVCQRKPCERSCSCRCIWSERHGGVHSMICQEVYPHWWNCLQSANVSVWNHAGPSTLCLRTFEPTRHSCLSGEN